MQQSKFLVYENSTHEGRVLLGSCDYRTAEILRQSFSGIEFVDTETDNLYLSRQLPDLDDNGANNALLESYGIKGGSSVLFSAYCVLGGIVGGLIITILAYLTQ